jgi:hypothetical protein
MGAVAISMDAVRKKADVRTTTFQKKQWTSKPWRGGMRIAEVMRKGKVNWRIIKMKPKKPTNKQILDAYGDSLNLMRLASRLADKEAKKQNLLPKKS